MLEAFLITVVRAHWGPCDSSAWKADLVDHGLDNCALEQLLQVALLIVADADGSAAPRLVEALQDAPGLQALGGVARRFDLCHARQECFHCNVSDACYLPPLVNTTGGAEQDLEQQ